MTFEDFRVSHECLADLLSPSTPDVNTDVEFNFFSSTDSKIEDDAVVESAVDTLCSLVEVNEDDTTVRLDTVRNALATRSRHIALLDINVNSLRCHLSCQKHMYIYM